MSYIRDLTGPHPMLTQIYDAKEHHKATSKTKRIKKYRRTPFGKRADMLTWLNHLPLVAHICVYELGQHWFRSWLVAYSAPSCYLIQWWVFVKWTLRNKFQWNFNQNTNLLVYDVVPENVVCETAAILSRVAWIKKAVIGSNNGLSPIQFQPIIPYHQFHL